MAELIFPSSPAFGQIFPDPEMAGVPQWRWDGAKWDLIRAAGGTGGGGDGGPGPPGASGAPGSQWLQGTAVPTGATGRVGDWFLNTSTYQTYEKTTESAWTARVNIRGATGPTGAQGPPGTGGAGGVTSFNTRTGAVTFTSTDLTNVGGALLASPTFTGTPAAPTAAANTNSTQIATTAFVTRDFVRKTGDIMTGGLTTRQNAGTAASYGGGLKITAANATATWTGTYGAMSADIMLSKSTGTGLCQVLGSTNGSLRWAAMWGGPLAEGGSNTGSPFYITRYNDSGANTGNALTISRPNGLCTFEIAIANGPSDRSMKENIRPITHALDKVLGLQGVTFNMIADETKTPQIGLIAQDVEPIVPEVVQPFMVSPLVQPDGEDGIDSHSDEQPTIKLALDYPKLTALLIEAIKSLKGEVDSLRKEVANGRSH